MKAILILSGMIYFFAAAFAQAPKATEYDLVIGTYSNKDKSNGIHVYRFNAKTGECTLLETKAGISNPSYLAISKDKKHLYAVGEEGQGQVNAFAFDPRSGKLTFLNSVTSGGEHPCYVSVDDQKKLVFVGNYNGGNLTAIRINADGSLSSTAQTINHRGSSVNTERQEKPHVHAVVVSPDQRYLCVPDLGTDKVNVYRIDYDAESPLKAVGEVAVKAGSGPRHLTFHPNGKYAYLIQELDASVAAFVYKDGKLSGDHSITMLAAGFDGKVGAADLHVSPDGKFLYASNRGDANEITIFSIDGRGNLSYAGRQSTLGKTPRNFAIDPSGNFLLAANQNSNDVVIFRRDKKTGMLADTGKRIMLDKPVCLKFVTLD